MARNWIRFRKGYSSTQFEETALAGFHATVPGWAASAV